ncbi:MAG: DUF3488 and DUF4129 domain-containing transglutaminase family protein [Candidatus Brocadiia bacterium]
MGLERPFRASILVLVGTGLAAVGLALGSPTWLFGGLFVFACCVVLRTVRPSWHLRPAFIAVGVLLVIQAVIAEVISTGSVLVPAAHFLILVQLIWLTNERTNRNYGWLALLSLLQMIVAGVLSVDLAFGACFAIYLPAGVVTLQLFNLRCELERNGLLSESHLREVRVGSRLLAGAGVVALAELALTVLVFMYFPRFGLQILQIPPVQKGERLRGFSDRVRFGDLASILDNPQVVMHVTLRRNGKPIKAADFPLRLRGVTLDTYQGATWTTRGFIEDYDLRSLPYPDRPPPQDGRHVVQEVTLEPVASRVLFYLPNLQRLDADSSNLEDVQYHMSSGTFKTARSGGVSLRYVAWSRIPRYKESTLRRPAAYPPAAYTRRRSADYTQVPETLGPRVRELAEEIVQDFTARQVYDRARAVRDFLYTRYSYSLSAGRRRRDVDPLEDFLFHRRQGHCEHFAGAMVLLLRTLDIPARMATGFSGGEWNEYGKFYVIRQRHAHAWAEVFIPAVRDWVAFDPTPAYVTRRPAEKAWLASLSRRLAALRLWWNSYVVNYSRQDQRKLAQSMSYFLSQLPSSLPSLWGRGRLFIESGYSGGLQVVFFLLSALAALAGVAFGAYALAGRLRRGERRRGRGGRPTVGFYRKMDDILRRRGFRRGPSVTPVEFASAVVAAGGEPFAPVRPLTEAFCRVRYGGQRLTSGQRAEVHRALAALEATKRPRAAPPTCPES